MAVKKTTATKKRRVPKIDDMWEYYPIGPGANIGSGGKKSIRKTKKK